MYRSADLNLLLAKYVHTGLENLQLIKDGVNFQFNIKDM
jgi:hypothetical protein